MSHVLALTALIVAAAAPTASAGGRLDRAFGGDGKVVTRVGAKVFVADVERAPGGGAYVLGNTGPPGSNVFGGRLVVVRYDRRGRLVKRFGRRGIARLRVAFGRATAAALEVLPDGRLLVAGTVGPFPDEAWLVARLTPRGGT